MTTYKKVNSDYIVETTGPTDKILLISPVTKVTQVLQLGIFTTSERNALTPENGQIIYNSTTNKFQGYAAGAWADLN
jgi:hypothetical protein